MKRRMAFTLVELLVLMTIIVILLTLLTPAIDRAMYQAELAVCMSKLHVVTTGAIAYASGNKRHYPDRPSFRATSAKGGARPFLIYGGNSGAAKSAAYTLDDRAILRQFLSINKTLLCPFVLPVDLDGADKNSYVASSYELYFGFQYTGLPGMFKLGDRLVFDDNRSNVLAADTDVINESNDIDYGSHLDNEPTMKPYRFQDTDYVGTG